MALRPLIASGNSELRAEALKLAGAWKLEVFRADAENIARDGTASETVRRAAIEAIASLGGERSNAILTVLAAPEEAVSVRSAAIAALSSFDLESAAEFASRSLARLNNGAAFDEIFSSFLRRQGGAATLAVALARRPLPKLAAEVGLRLMNAGGRRNDQLARVLADAAGFNREGKTVTSAEIAAFASEVRASGDARHGAEIFHRAELGCTACHSVNGQGGNVGPDLSALGTAQPVDFIIGAILDPQKEVKEGYMSMSVVTKDGEEFQGYQVRETRGELVLRDVLQNKEVRLRRETIKQTKQNGSVMPGGLADTLTRAEFRDLVRFLSELGKPR